MFNSAKIYERSFKPVEGGYLYYPHRWSGGYLISPDEHARLISDWRQLTGVSGMLKLMGVLVIWAIAQVIVETTSGLDSEIIWILAPEVPAAAIVIYVIWKSSAAYRLVRTRNPIMPRRNFREILEDQARIFSWPLAIFNMVLSIWFCILSALIALSSPLIGVPLLMLFLFATYLNAKTVYLKWATRGR